ncbi:Spherulation-specific family 4-domain-containing protein [Talaromyces proteolyticus]|uniref:Spherulation-specific family 4-domain-containing protein n=1 Tax=Talaromyces proteolyticus TaxID=1131652 RepID=A0AAD4KX74_9EURO|nr:Spherulation-specific family 4-domain-containing protein [Talaromyces proteolyticus]KAH8697944.1 Spherulation-specific family 4-domain-containing protein [Talaromyces proteolyticus]
MRVSTLLSGLSITGLVTATDLLLPLYIYPSAGPIQPVYDAVTSNPNATFYVIVDPDSGPGGSQYPNSDYITALAKLNTYSNVQTIGYVHTSYMAQTTDAIAANVSRYAGWSNYSDSNIAVKGIFFDEATNTQNSAAYAYMSTIASNARDQGLDFVIFNPGTVVTAPEFFEAADLIVVEEVAYSTYQAGTIQSVPEQYRNQSAIILHDTPSGTNLTSVVSGMESDTLGAFYATADCCYQSVTILGSVASALAASN